MKKYVSPELEIAELEANDIIMSDENPITVEYEKTENGGTIANLYLGITNLFGGKSNS